MIKMPHRTSEPQPIRIPPKPPEPVEPPLERLAVCKQRAAAMLDICERTVKLVVEKRLFPVYVGVKPLFGGDMLRRFANGEMEIDNKPENVEDDDEKGVAPNTAPL